MDISLTHSQSCCSATNVSFSETRTCRTFLSSGSFTNDDLLTVFQADPLVYVDADGPHPTNFLDFESERTLLADSLTDCVIPVELKFDYATPERVGRFLARAEGRVLHLSCHGHPDFLAIENGWGAMHMLPVEKLRDWIEAGGGYLKFVFVSACYSRSAGEAFVAAGVRHVVCCQRNDQPILNVAAEIFARAFYQALANGRVLSQAFDLARQEVLNTPNLSRDQAREEAKKFALLPKKNTDHNVHIFEHSSQLPNRHFLSKRSSTLSEPTSGRILPLPPQIFLNRNVDTWKILDALKSARVVRVTGAQGVGKGSIVQMVCQYIGDRLGSCMRTIGEMIWLPTEDQHDALYDLSQIFNSHEYKCPAKLLCYLHEHKVLLVLDARKAQSMQSFENIKSFISDVIHHTRGTRVIVIHQIESDSKIIQSLPCKERDFTLKSLNFISTVRLFGKLCQHVTNKVCSQVSNPSELCALLIPEDSPTVKPRSRRGRDIFKMVGEGIPMKIHQAAKGMTCQEYKRMIALGLQKELELKFESRAELEKEISEHKLQLELARNEKRWSDALEHRHFLDEMELLREELLSLSTLQLLAKSLEADVLTASKTDDFWMCIELQQELDAIEEKIKVELSALEKLGINLTNEKEKIPSRSDELEQYHNNGVSDIQIDCLKSLEMKLDNALDCNDFDQARNLEAQIKSLKSQTSTLFVQEELEKKVIALQQELREAKAVRNIDLAQTLDIQLRKTLEQLEEEKADNNFNETMNVELQEERNLFVMVCETNSTVSTENAGMRYVCNDARKPGAIPVSGNAGSEKHSETHSETTDAKMHPDAAVQRPSVLPSVPSASLPTALSNEAKALSKKDSSALVDTQKPGAVAVAGNLVTTRNPHTREATRPHSASNEQRELSTPSPRFAVSAPARLSVRDDRVIHAEVSNPNSEALHQTLPGAHSLWGSYDRYEFLHGVTDRLEQNIHESRSTRGNRGRTRGRNNRKHMSRSCEH